MAVIDSVDEKKDEMTYYMMNMPEWFLNLSDEKKIDLAKKFSSKTNPTNILDKEDVVELLVGSN